MHRNRHRLALNLVALTLAISACDQSDRSSEWAVSIDTLASGTVHVINTPPVQDPPMSQVLREEFRIGTIEGGGPTSFGQLKGLAITQNEQVVVLDAIAQDLRVFSPDGSHIATYGGRGRGPGELETAYGLMLSPTGMAWVPDPGNTRMSVYDPDVGYQEAFPLRVYTYGFVWRGLMTDEGHVFKRSLRYDAPGKNLLRVYDHRMNPIDSLPLHDDILSPNPEGRPDIFYAEVLGREEFGMEVPFYPRAKHLLDPRGFVWSTGEGDPSYRIVRWVPGGDTTLILETRRPPRQIPAAVRDSVIDGIRERFDEYGGARQDWSKVPKVRSSVSLMFLAENGDLWVRVPSAGDYRYEVYEQTGQFRRAITTSLRIYSWVAPIIRGNQIWAVVTDELNVQYVVRARIEAPAAE